MNAKRAIIRQQNMRTLITLLRTFYPECRERERVEKERERGIHIVGQFGGSLSTHIGLLLLMPDGR